MPLAQAARPPRAKAKKVGRAKAGPLRRAHPRASGVAQLVIRHDLETISCGSGGSLSELELAEAGRHLPAPMPARRFSVEMEPAVAAAEIEQGIDRGVEARLDHLPHQYVVVAPIIDRVALALEYAQRFAENWSAALAA